MMRRSGLEGCCSERGTDRGDLQETQSSGSRNIEMTESMGREEGLDTGDGGEGNEG